MNKNYLIGIIAVIIIIGIAVGVKLGGNLTGGSQTKVNDSDVDVNTRETIGSDEVTVIPIEPTLTSAPTPTFAPISDTIKSITGDNIVATGKGGDMNLPKNPEILTVYFQRGTEQVRATFDDVKVGQNVTIKIITPGKKADLIILQ